MTHQSGNIIWQCWHVKIWSSFRNWSVMKKIFQHFFRIIGSWNRDIRTNLNENLFKVCNAVLKVFPRPPFDGLFSSYRATVSQLSPKKSYWCHWAVYVLCRLHNSLKPRTISMIFCILVWARGKTTFFPLGNRLNSG